MLRSAKPVSVSEQNGGDRREENEMELTTTVLIVFETITVWKIVIQIRLGEYPKKSAKPTHDNNVD